MLDARFKLKPERKEADSRAKDARPLELSYSLGRRVSVPDEVANFLRESILGGTLKPGERIVEGRIAKQLRIGYPTVREALKTLETEGLVRRQPNRGCSVTELTPEEVNQIFYLRVEWEPMAAALAVENREKWKSQQALLVDTFNEFKRAARRENLAEFLRADITFHKAIWRFSGNAFLERALSQVTAPQLAFAAIKVLSHPGTSWASIVSAHQQMARAVLKGDKESARQIVRRVLEEFWKKTKAREDEFCAT